MKEKSSSYVYAEFLFYPIGNIFPLFQVIDETLDVKEMIFNAERVGGLEEAPVGV